MRRPQRESFHREYDPWQTPFFFPRVCHVGSCCVILQIRNGREMRDGSVAEVRLAGVKHNDLLNKQNVLWNAEMQHAMVVDFENVDATDKKP